MGVNSGLAAVGGASGFGSAAPGVVTVSPIGLLTSGVSLTNNGCNYGPDTLGTTTSGIQEALTALEPTGGKLVLCLDNLHGLGVFNITSNMTYTSDYAITIEGVTRGREEFSATTADAYGVFLMVNTLGSGTFALTINVNTSNLGMCRLSNFTMRGIALGTTGSSGGMRGVTFSGGPQGSPGQVEIDNIAFEYMTDPFQFLNGDDGPLIVDWIGFFECACSTAMMEIVAGTATINHVEVYNSGNAIAFGGSDYTDLTVNHLWCNAGTALVAGFTGYNPAALTTIYVGSMNVGDPWGGSVLLLNNNSSSAVHITIGTLTQDVGSNSGYIVQQTNANSNGQITVTANRYVGNYTKLISNSGGGTVAAGSFVLLRAATLLAAPGGADTTFANMTSFVEEVGSTYTLASLTGTTAGTASSGFDRFDVTDKRFKVFLNGYENTSGTSQTITFPYPFALTPAVVHDDSGGATVSTTAVTLPHSMGSTKTGWILIEGR